MKEDVEKSGVMITMMNLTGKLALATAAKDAVVNFNANVVPQGRGGI